MLSRSIEAAAGAGPNRKGGGCSVCVTAEARDGARSPVVDSERETHPEIRYRDPADNGSALLDDGEPEPLDQRTRRET
jgi:hypothetical protein